MEHNTLTRAALLTSVGAALILTASPATAQPSKHRRVKGGSGNCIFSSQNLPRNRESTYRNIRTTFDASKHKVIYARCYAPKKLAAYTRLGKLYNQLRNKGHYETTFWFDRGLPIRGEVITRPYRPRHRKRDQALFYIGKRSQCDYCFDLVEKARKLWGNPAARPRRFCVMNTILIADRYKPQWIWVKGVRKRPLDKRLHVIFRGCFKLKFPSK